MKTTIFRGKLKEIANEGAKIFTEELASFFRSNPNSVFVLAAGNEKRDLSKGIDHSANIQAENLIKVAAIDGKGKIAPFSNRSSSFVEVAAIGTGVASAMVGGGKMHMSGTSQAAPDVANAMAQIFESAPQLSAKEAVEALYARRTTTDSSLVNLVANGRVLKAAEVQSETGHLQKERWSVVRVEFESLSDDKDFSKLINIYAKKMVSESQGSQEVIITKDGIDDTSISFKNSQGGQIDVLVSQFSTIKPKSRKAVGNSGAGATMSCAGLHAAP